MNINRDNYFKNSKGVFTEILKSEYELIGDSLIDFTSEKSEYKIVGDCLYRKSDHWGRVANCRWSIKKIEATILIDENYGGFLYGKINFKDLKVYKIPKLYKKIDEAKKYVHENEQTNFDDIKLFYYYNDIIKGNWDNTYSEYKEAINYFNKNKYIK